MAVPTGKDDEGLGGARAAGCASCGATLASSQRYCLECGARRGPVPAAFAKWLSIARPDADSEVAAGDAALSAEEGAVATAAAGDAVFEDSSLAERFMPEPRSAAIATMALLAFGVVVGAATGPLAQSAGLSPIVIEMGSSPSTASAEPEGEASEPIAEAPVEPPQAIPSSVPIEPQPESSPAGPKKTMTETYEEEALPPIQHVFVIALGENGYEETFGESSSGPYLAKTLREKGELISNYYAVTKGDLANQIALVSGQGPTPETAANCPSYGDLAPGALSAEKQVEGRGCVYPAETPTLPGLLAEKQLKWRAYVEDIGNGTDAGQPATCRHPALDSPDPSQAPHPGDAYVTWRNPFVYFHSLADGPECAEDDVGLEQLTPDLATAAKTPALSYIVPNACHSGGEQPCEPGQPAGPLAAESFLRQVVPAIEASPAFKSGGLIAITSSQAPQAGPKADSSSCCISPAYPNMPAETSTEAVTGPVKPIGGGGNVGLLLISPFVRPGSGSEVAGYYNHYSLLRSIEDLFGLEPIGYAGDPAVAGFDATVYNAEP